VADDDALRVVYPTVRAAVEGLHATANG